MVHPSAASAVVAAVCLAWLRRGLCLRETSGVRFLGGGGTQTTSPPPVAETGESGSLAGETTSPPPVAETGESGSLAGEAWFLTQDEVKRSRNGHERKDVRHVSMNTIQYLPNGDRFMPRVYELIKAAGQGDFVFFTCWDLNVDMMLHPLATDPAESERSRLINALGTASDRGADIRVLLSSAGPALGVAPTSCSRLNERLGPDACVLDSRHAGEATGSSHMKTWAIRLNGHLVAFTGSMDVTTGRFDSAAHQGLQDPNVQLEPVDPIRRYGWHGTMYEILGDGARDILATFLDRWNDPVKPIGYENLTVLPSAAKLVALAKGPLPKVLRPQDEQKVDMQVLRTVGCAATTGGHIWSYSPLYQNFAPNGEYTYAAAWYKALRNARRYIFVADQFMFFDEAMAAVAEAARHVDFVIVLTNSQQQDLRLRIPYYGNLDVPLSAWQMTLQHYQHHALFDALAQLDPSGKLAKKVHMFHLLKEGMDESDTSNQIYDHEKTLIVDDVFALVGSAGVERTAFTNDNELSVSVYSPEWVADLRRKIFAEFLMLDPSDPKLASPAVAFAEWLRQADNGTQRVRRYQPISSPAFYNRFVATLIYNFIEPDGRCGKGFEDMWPGKWHWD